MAGLLRPAAERALQPCLKCDGLQAPLNRRCCLCPSALLLCTPAPHPTRSLHRCLAAAAVAATIPDKPPGSKYRHQWFQSPERVEVRAPLGFVQV